MIAQCECGKKLKPKAGCNPKPGQSVILTCPCGQRLRFKVPEIRTPSAARDALDEMLKQYRQHMGQQG